jgi:hypothetical protein
MSTTYRKTAKGIAEIETRAHRLPPRTRSLLILVDGKRDADALGRLAPQQCDETLAELLTQGFIEAAPRPAAATRSAPAAAAPPPAAPAAAFEARRRAVVRALTDAIGPASETLAIKLERSSGPEELEPLVLQAIQLVATVRGRSAGEALAAKLYPPP